MSYEKIIANLQNKIYSPIYFLCGEETYYTDKITNYIANNILPESERAFNQITMYGKDTNINTVIDTARRFPMMSEFQVIIVKEAQHMQKLEDLVAYVESPLKSTILVINYKYKKLDKRSKLYKKLSSNSVFLQSDKIREYNVSKWIDAHLKNEGLSADFKTVHLLAEHLGNDLTHISNEINKLKITLKGRNKITLTDIEENIGISKEYNIFEFSKAIGEKNAYKANKIANYFGANKKKCPMIMTISTLFSYFQKLMLIHTADDKSEQGLARDLKIHPFILKEYIAASRNYPSRNVVKVISILREYDMTLKGFENASIPEDQLIKEMTF